MRIFNGIIISLLCVLFWACQNNLLTKLCDFEVLHIETYSNKNLKANKKFIAIAVKSDEVLGPVKSIEHYNIILYDKKQDSTIEMIIYADYKYFSIGNKYFKAKEPLLYQISPVP